MKFSDPISVKTLAEKYNLKIIGDDSMMATGINEIRKVEVGDITFSDVKKYFKKSLESAATIILLNEVTECPPGKVILIAKDPFKVYNSIVTKQRPLRPLSANVAITANVHSSAIIEPGVIIGPNVRIGKYSHIQANTVIMEHTIIGDHVTIQPGTVIGSDAFYYKRGKEGHTKWRSGGRVVIEDHVEIGALNTINKGVSGDTIIGEGTKLDCQVHVGHGVVIGKRCLLAAGVLIAGKATIGNDVVLYGAVGVVQAINIEDNVTVLAKTLVNKNLPANKTYNGLPARESTQRNREIIALKNLPEFMKKNR